MATGRYVSASAGAGARSVPVPRARTYCVRPNGRVGGHCDYFFPSFSGLWFVVWTGYGEGPTGPKVRSWRSDGLSITS